MVAGQLGVPSRQLGGRLLEVLAILEGMPGLPAVVSARVAHVVVGSRPPAGDRCGPPPTWGEKSAQLPLSPPKDMGDPAAFEN